MWLNFVINFERNFQRYFVNFVENLHALYFFFFLIPPSSEQTPTQKLLFLNNFTNSLIGHLQYSTRKPSYDATSFPNKVSFPYHFEEFQSQSSWKFWMWYFPCKDETGWKLGFFSFINISKYQGIRKKTFIHCFCGNIFLISTSWPQEFLGIIAIARIKWI